MKTCQMQDSCGFGCQLTEAAECSRQDLDQLFLALLLTASGVFLGANLLLLDLGTLIRSARIAAACCALLALYYTLSCQTKSLLWGLVLTCGAVWAVVVLRAPWLTAPLYGAAVLPLLHGKGARLLQAARRDPLPPFLMAAAAAATIAGMEGYTSFDMLPRLHLGAVHQDTLYHASIAAMIKNYGVASTGLHGLVETPYHILSHEMMAGISLLSGVSVLEVYGVANPMLFAPLLIFSVTACCALLDAPRRLPLPLLWGTVCLALALLPAVFGRWMILQRPFFISESYVLSLSLFTLGLTLLCKRWLSAADLLLAVLLAAMIAKAKASTGLIFAGLWLARLLFLCQGRRERGNTLAACLLSAAAAAWVISGSAQSVAGTTAFVEPFRLMRGGAPHLDAVLTALAAGQDISWADAGLAVLALLSFFTFHFFLSWAVIVLIGRRSPSGILRAPLSLYSLAAVFAGGVIASVFNLGGGSSFYFSNVAFFVSLPAAAALLTDRLRQADPKKALLIFGVMICAAEAQGLVRNSALHHVSAPAANPLISRLTELRQTSPKHVVLRAAPKILADSPVRNCPARPFVFPAVSERPWTGVLEPGGPACWYRYYGYELYGLGGGQQQITAAPVLRPGMVIQDLRP